MADIALTPPPVDLLATRKAAFPTDVSGVKTHAEAEAVAQEFERMFVAEMLQPMFAGIDTDGPFGGGQAEDVFRPMLLDRYADAVAKAGGVGIADAVLKEILRLQGLE
jgi:Rod binding domain-containing protein